MSSRGEEAQIRTELKILAEDLERIRQGTLRLARRVGVHELEIISAATARSQLAVAALIADQKPESTT